MSFASFGGELQDAETAAFTDPFSELTGAKVAQDAADYAKLDAQVRSGNVNFDVFHADGFWVTAQCGNLFEPLGPSVDMSAVGEEYISSDCGVPIAQVAVMMVYNTEKYGDNPPTSWADFFDTERFPGKRGLYATSVFAQWEGALLADGVAPADLYPLDAERALKKMDSIKDDIVYYDELAQSVEQMVSQAWDMGIVFNGRAYAAVKEGAPYAPVWNQAVRAWDNVALAKGAPNPEAGRALLNYIATPEAQTALAEQITYAPTTPDSEPKLDALKQKFMPSNPKNEKQAILLDTKYWADHSEELQQEWVEWTSD